MAGHPLRNFDTSAIRQVVRNPGGAEGVAAYRGFDAGVGGAAAPMLLRTLPFPVVCPAL
jgi:hypothetical protein